MGTLDDLRSLNTVLVESQPLVAVFFGGTRGIGHYTLRELSRTVNSSGKGLRAYLVGRNTEAAEEIIAECRGIYPRGEFVFVKADDAALIKDVDQVCAEIVRLEELSGQTEARIDYLMLSQGAMPFLPRKDTKEGLDVTMSLFYYSRMRAITKLLPLLLRSKLSAHVVSVYAAGMDGEFFPEDLSLRDLSRYNYSRVRSHVCYMHVLFMESLAEQHRGKLALVHVFPGLVHGKGFESAELPVWLRVFWNWIFMPLFGRWLTVQPELCGQRMVSYASTRYPPRPVDASQAPDDCVVGTSGRPSSGVYSLSQKGENNIRAYRYKEMDKDKMRAKVWGHTTRAFEVIEAGHVFDE